MQIVDNHPPVTWRAYDDDNESKDGEIVVPMDDFSMREVRFVLQKVSTP